MCYVNDVADLFLSRCSSLTILSPMDYTVIAEWEKQEIPLTVVIDSINRSCDELGERVAEIETIADFRATVKQNYVDWLQISAAV